ncbi:hypothetical protein U0027_24110 (plasmid) [Agrobacterium tumefaciens]|uniref:SMa0974 family conjugal transfer regulator n=1 Tax=Agrobacterium tumefaciens TaxID=358 RepID=UPI000E0AD09B|nr:hypothetical protein [Agrobacterium tumefaciens]WQE43505.1 hypothetical protein U0027_24110 [Agrobacterium tumefaciens]
MYKNVAETFVALEQPPSVVEEFCSQNLNFCLSIITHETDRLLQFEDGHATIRITDNGLIFRVSARDLVTFYGIRTLIEGSLTKFTSGSVKSIEWLNTKNTPFFDNHQQRPHGTAG